MHKTLSFSKVHEWVTVMRHYLRGLSPNCSLLIFADYPRQRSMILNPITFYFLDPTDLHKSIKEYDEEYYQSIVKVEKQGAKIEENVTHLIEEAMKIERGEPLSTVDLYSLLECPKRYNATNDELLAHYKQMILRFHPDKCHHLGIKDEMFKAITLAHELLSDVKTRRSYDSMDPFYAIHTPLPEEYMNGEQVDEEKFNKVFSKYFNQLAHFSDKKKMPAFSDIKEEKVGIFYSSWLKYTSWRTFDLDSIIELRNTSGGRDERRHRQKELQKEWEKNRKIAAVEISETIQKSMQLDPRCQKLKEKELAEKERKKNEIRDRKIAMAKARNGGKLPQAPVKKVVIKQVVKPASKPEKLPDWTKEESAALIQAIKKIPGGATNRFDKIAQEIKKQCKTLHLRTKADVIEKMKLIKNGDNEGIKDLQTKVDKSGDVTEATIDYDRKAEMTAEWTKEQQKQLEAAMKKYSDKSDKDRWEKIAEMVDGQDKKSVVKRVVELKSKLNQKK
eukprot:NODE_7_length_48057_cov_0.322240.p6 type:complete len:503 gc:universal NODE_7_length_48057_cov_0.322240:5480-3972(-)